MTSNTSHFADRLIAAVRAKHTSVLVGLDPRAQNLPAGILTGSGLEVTASAFALFCRGVIDVVAPLVPAVKPQAAFFEQLGPTGMRALKDTIDYAAAKGLLVILDGKRNDIGSTATGYAEAYLGRGEASAWGCDALTVSPYLGDDSLTPFIETAQARGAGIFVLAKTSNPGGKRFQDIVGAVVGATYPAQLAELRAAMPHTWLLIPGYGAQGGTAKDCAAAFDAKGL